ncbi:MAG TPA: hypothetical protein VKU41_09250 [Polyangiaceae bacterium]|nr:hypothetical protein [Polyangiaceae bacterium]
MGSSCVRLAAAAVALAVLGAAVPALADPTAADRETARSLMAEARDLRDKGDLQGALKRFQAADGIMHVPTTAFEVAKTQAAVGLLVEARDTIALIRKSPQKPTDPEPFNEARNKAEELDTALEGRIPSLSISVEGATEGETPTISIDGVQLPAAAAGLPRRVDPGHHVVTAKTAAGEGSQDVDVREKESKQVQVTIVAGTTPPMGGPDNGGQTPPAEAGGEEETTSHAPSLLTWVGVGVAGAGVLAGSITGLIVLSDTSKLSSDCNKQTKQCVTMSSQNELSSANSLATVSTISFIVGGVGAALAVGSLVVGHGIPAAATAPPPSAASRVEVIPWIGLGSAGVRGTF